MPDMKTLSINGTTYTVVDETARAAANSKEPAGTAAGLLNRTTAVNAADTNYTTYMARGEALFSTETTPSVNGAIAWQYG